MSNPIAILSAMRTPMGGMMGSLSSLSASDLGGVAISSAITKSGLNASDIDEVIMGSVLTAGQRQAPARQARPRPASPAALAAQGAIARQAELQAQECRSVQAAAQLPPPDSQAPPRSPDQVAPLSRQRAPISAAAAFALLVRLPELAPRARIHSRPTKCNNASKA